MGQRVVTSVTTAILLFHVGCSPHGPGQGTASGSTATGDASGSGGTPGTGGASGSAGGSGGAGDAGAAGAAGSAPGCGGGAPDDGGTMSDGGAPPDADGGFVPSAYFRIVNARDPAFSPDFCLRHHDDGNSGNFDIGPLMRSLGVSGGIPYTKVSRFFEIPHGRYDIRTVSGDATDCTQVTAGGLPVFGADGVLPEFESGSYWTLVETGKPAGTPVPPVPFLERNHFADAGRVAIRFLNDMHAAPNVDFGFGVGSDFYPVVTDVGPLESGARPSGPGVDALGYVQTSPVRRAIPTVRASGSSRDVVSGAPIDIIERQVSEIFAAGPFGSEAMRIIVCTAPDPNRAPIFSDCQASLLQSSDAGPGPNPADAGTPDGAGSDPTEGGTADAPTVEPDGGAPCGGNPTTHFRISATGGGGIDVCLRAHDGAPTFDRPWMQTHGSAEGLVYPKVSMYFDVPAAKYDVRIVAAGAVDCSKNLYFRDFTDLPTLEAGKWWTFITSGTLDKGFVVAVYEDERAAAPGQVGVRFLNDGYPPEAVDFGLMSGDTFTSLFTHVDSVFHNGIGTGGAVDARGYLQIGAVSDVIPTVRRPDDAQVLMKGPRVDLGAGDVVSFFAATPYPNGPVVYCRDLDPPVPPWSACTTVP